MSNNALWSGRFDAAPDADVYAYGLSVADPFLRGTGKTAAPAHDILAEHLPEEAMRSYDQDATVAEARRRGDSMERLSPIIITTPKELRYDKNTEGFYGNDKMAFPSDAYPHGRNSWDIPGCGRLAWASDNDLDGVNLLKPGKTPHQNVRFLLFLAAVLKAVHKHAGLIRAGIATSGNEHRLGANEAPPAIISVFMGDMLTKVIEDIAAGRAGKGGAAQAMLHLGVAKLPEVAKDNTDRNRTSPFAFTGAKFEFRAVGSSQSIAFPVMLLNATVAESIAELTDKLRAELKKTKNRDDAVLKIVSAAFRETKAIRFEGNNYSDAWVVEAKKRGLPNLRRSPEALAQIVSPASRKLFTSGPPSS